VCPIVPPATDAVAYGPSSVFWFARMRLAGSSLRLIFAGRPGRRSDSGGSAEPERNRQRDGAAHQSHRMDEDDRDVADAEAVEQPDREVPDVHGEEAGRDVA
jgi:hypothetical protein